MGWTNPKVLGGIFGGLAVLILFVVIEFNVANPMIQLKLFRIRAFTTASSRRCWRRGPGRAPIHADHLVQGIWLPQHGYSFARTPLWAGIALVPLTIGFMISGPIFGIMADRLGAREVATIGLVVRGVLPAARAPSYGFSLRSFCGDPLLLVVLLGMFIARTRRQ